MMRIASCSSTDGAPRWYPPMPTMETFSPVRPRVRRGTGWSAAPDDCGCSEAAKLITADFLRKSLRSIEASEKFGCYFEAAVTRRGKVCHQLCISSQPEREKFISSLIVRSIQLAPQSRFLLPSATHPAAAARSQSPHRETREYQTSRRVTVLLLRAA